jgi:uncharacterized protein YceH (UPF0502 family)
MLTRPLDPVEIRVLGVLLEKERTTPEAYPMTTNGVITACNQKSNRDPVTDYDETAVTEALDRLRSEVLVWRSETARAERWAHCLDRRWHLDSAGKAVMALLLLRGAQTPGELRTRSERLHAFASVEDVERALATLARGSDPLVRELPRRPGQREARWLHLVGNAAATAAASAAAMAEEVVPGAGEPVAVTPAPGGRGPAPAPPPAVDLLVRLESRIASLETQVAQLTATLDGLRQRLGDEA